MFCSLYFIQFEIVIDDDMPENAQPEDNPNQNGKMKIKILFIPRIFL